MPVSIGYVVSSVINPLREEADNSPSAFSGLLVLSATSNLTICFPLRPQSLTPRLSYRFIYGFPPFHDETPEKVFENILSRRFDWHEDEIDISADARDFIDRLLCTDARRRLGARGADEVKAHPFLEGVDWDNLLKGPVEFVPNVEDPENTDYFDARGAQAQNFNDEEPDPSVAEDPAVRQAQGPTPASTPGPGRGPRDRSETAPNPHDDFGTFSFRNLTVLKQANDDMIRKMKDEQLLPPLNNPLSIPSKGHSRSRNNSADVRVSSHHLFVIGPELIIYLSFAGSRITIFSIR